jgi:hypothetical protein
VGVFNAYGKAALEHELQGGSAPAGFEVGLFNCTPTRTDTAATLTGELSGNGYARVALGRNTTDWPTINPDTDGHPRLTSKEIFFTATATWSAVTVWVLLTTAGAVVAWGDLGSSITLAAGKTMGLRVSLKGVTEMPVKGSIDALGGGIVENIYSAAALTKKASYKEYPGADDLFQYVDNNEASAVIKKILWDDLKQLIQYANRAAFPTTGNADRYYFALDTGILYRWSGTAYVAMTSAVPIVTDSNGVQWRITIDTAGNLGASSL